MPKKMNKKRLVLALSIAGCVAYAILTGGVAIMNSRDFSGQRNVRIVDGVESDLWLAPSRSEWGIPLVCHYYGTSGPFGLRIQIWDESRSYTSIQIDEILVAYDDGQATRISEKWNRDLKDYTLHNSSSSGLIETRMMMLSDTISNLVTQHQNVTITFRGSLGTADGRVIPFSTTERFEAETNFGFATYWQILAGC
jgi:hypothetical protein